MNNPDDTYWGRYAQTYDGDADYVVGRDLRRGLRARLRRETGLGVLLEYGCGTGYYTGVAVLQAKRIVAMDLSGEMLAAAKARLAGTPHVSFLQADCRRRTFHPTSFDTVLMANILNNLSAPLPVLCEAHHVLKYGGVLIAIAYTDYHASALERIEIGKRYFERFGWPPPGGLNNYSPRQLTSLLRLAGFTNVVMEELGDTVRALYARAIKGYVTDDTPDDERSVGRF
ncbi:MAG: class I SAM-dependent methyltransferase [Pseudomonadota bacterium]|nr:class I SAM-dependent methyltransferase [Pseudomonadota bacterium]